MVKIKKLGVLSFAKFQAILFALPGVVAGIVYSFGGLIYDLMTIGLNTGTLLAFMALIGMPLLFGVFGFVLGIAEAILFNMTVNWFGGIELNTETY